MAATTLNQLVIGAKTAANAQVGGAWSTQEWQDACNRAYEAMWIDILGVNSAFRLTTTTFTLTTPTQSTALPVDFMAVYKLVKDAGTANRLTIERAPDEVLDGLQRTYRIEGNNLFVDPLELCSGNYQLRYNPTLVQMGSGGPDMDTELGQFREYVELAAACAYLDSEEASSSIQEARFNVIVKRLSQWAEGSRSSGVSVPRDVRSRWRGNRLYPY